MIQSSTVKVESISVGSVSPGGVKLETSTKEVPVVHTETKTITYESSQVRRSVRTWRLHGFGHSSLTTWHQSKRLEDPAAKPRLEEQCSATVSLIADYGGVGAQPGPQIT